MLRPILLPLLAGLASGQQPVFRAHDFHQSVGINGAPIRTGVHSGGKHAGAGKIPDPEIFHDLGIRHYRMPLKYALTLPDQPAQVGAAYRRSGARAMMLIDHNKSVPGEITELVKQYLPASIAEIEGPNEVNNKFGDDLNLEYEGKIDEHAAAAFMDDVYRSLKADRATKDIPVVAFTSIFSDYRAARPHDSFDFGNIHSYQGYDVPGSSLLMNVTRFNNIYPAGATIKPFVPTECGYNVEADATNGTFKTGSLRAQALNIPMLLAEYFRHGIRRTYLFAIRNADGYGLLEDDMKTRRPSYHAVRNFLAEISDSAWDPDRLAWEGGTDFTPRALMFSMPGAPGSVRSLTLQKQSGEWSLLIWNEVRNFDQNARKDLFPKPAPVVLDLASGIRGDAEVLVQNSSGSYDKRSVAIRDGKLALEVPSSVMIVRLKPTEAEDATPPAKPGGAGGSATENVVSFKWQAVADADLSAYLVYRNDGFLLATRETRFEDKSAWVRPGLGYRYAVRAVDRSGNLSDPAEAVIVTPDKRPDFVITSLEVPEVVDGKYRFRGTFKNVGNGASPHGVPCSMVFKVDGKTQTFGGSGGEPIPPGGSVTVEKVGGEAKPGARVVSAQLDDVNRVSGEKSESNNVADRSIPASGSSAPVILGSSFPAPGAFDLDREGTLDWAVWGVAGKDSVVRRKGGPGLISELGSVGKGYRDATSGCGVRLSWSGGEPVGENGGTNTGLWLNNVGHGFEFEVAAAPRERTLRVIVGGIEGARGRFEARWAGDSAPGYVSTLWSGEGAMEWASVPGGFDALYTVRFKSAKPGAKLLVRWVLDGEPNRFRGQARLQAAALSESDP